jgi:virulence-associated protein VagC
MLTKVTEEGVIIPKELLEGVTEVDIRKQDGIIVVVPTGDESASEASTQTRVHVARSWVEIPEDDPIYDIGKNPVTLDITDASENLDRYIYGGE